MKQRTLGTATVTAIGIGELRLATAARRGIDARDVERALHDALHLGITLVDVADEDGAERLAGDTVRALRLRDRVTVATRVPALTEIRAFPRHVRERVEATLRASRLDVLPYVQLPLRAAWRWAQRSSWPNRRRACQASIIEWAGSWSPRFAEPPSPGAGRLGVRLLPVRSTFPR